MITDSKHKPKHIPRYQGFTKTKPIIAASIAVSGLMPLKNPRTLVISMIIPAIYVTTGRLTKKQTIPKRAKIVLIKSFDVILVTHIPCMYTTSLH